MGFVHYLLLGSLCYAVGWTLRNYVLVKSPQVSDYNKQGLKHPTIMKYLGVFFVIMLVVSWLIGLFLLDHGSPDIPFIIVNSAVATFIFSFGLSPEQKSYDVPD